MRRTFDVNIYREHFPAVLTKATDGQFSLVELKPVKY